MTAAANCRAWPDRWFFLELPHGRRTGIVLPGGLWVDPHRASAAQWVQAAALATTRKRRCRPSSASWWRYWGIVAEADRRRRESFAIVAGGADR